MALWRVPLLFIGVCVCDAATLECVNDYISSVSCVWRGSRDGCVLRGQGDEERSCDLKLQDRLRRCSLSFHSSNFFFLSELSLWVNCDGLNDSVLLYRPARHIQTRAPERPSFSRNTLSWTLGSDFPELIDDCEYQLQVRGAGSGWETAKSRTVTHGRHALLDPASLSGGWYEARVRVKPVESRDPEDLRGEWSSWSPSVRWRSETRPSAAEVCVLSAAAVLLLLLLLLLACCGIRWRCLWLRLSRFPHLPRVPDPSSYFLPLHAVHGGNFAKWLNRPSAAAALLVPQSRDLMSRAELMTRAELMSWAEPCGSGTSRRSSSGYSNLGYLCTRPRTGTDSAPPRPEPRSPDSGLGLATEDVEESRPLPASEPPPAAAPAHPEPTEGATPRPASLTEPCGGGYLTLKDMPKYSNRSI